MFNVAADGLSCLVRKAQDEWLITGLNPHVIDKGVVSIQYATDTAFHLYIVIYKELET
jgi:hypothetical protein